jgi:hypothetical protein
MERALLRKGGPTESTDWPNWPPIPRRRRAQQDAGGSIVKVKAYLAVVLGFLALIANANSSSRRIATDREGLSFSCWAHLSISALNAGGSRTASTGLSPVRGRPRFFRNTGIDFPIIPYYVKCEPVESGNFPPALTQANGGNPWLRLITCLTQFAP